MIELEEICLNHVIGRSKVSGLERMGLLERPPQEQYCPGCTYDDKNKQCPYYKGVRLYTFTIYDE